MIRAHFCSYYTGFPPVRERDALSASQFLIPDTLITYYLHMTSPADFVPGFIDDDRLTIIPMRQPDVRYYKFLYTSVGETLRWRDRLLMPEADLLNALRQPGCSVSVLFVDGVPAGYYELVKDSQAVTELAYFGLRPEFHGQGLGKHLLSCAIQQAWDADAVRLWVHTCNLDAPAALPNYQKRGFTIYDIVTVPMPDRYK
jgi:GNAT superfamily N-acetyltransferase